VTPNPAGRRPLGRLPARSGHSVIRAPGGITPYLYVVFVSVQVRPIRSHDTEPIFELVIL
jgi:hypothetical protein